MSGSQRRKNKKMRGGKKLVQHGRPTSQARFAVQHKESLGQGRPKRIQVQDYAKYDEPTCNAHIEGVDEDGKPLGKSGFVKTRTKKTKMGPAGSQYYVPIDTRPFCGEPAVKTKLDENGARQHRCLKHSFADE